MIDGRIRFFRQSRGAAETDFREEARRVSNANQLMKSNALDVGGVFLIGIESAIGASPISAFSFLQLHPNDPHLYNFVNPDNLGNPV